MDTAWRALRYLAGAAAGIIAAVMPAAAATAANDPYPANVDYATGGYGAYRAAALADSWLQGVVINMDWSSVEKSRGSYNWAPLDRTAAAWAQAGKHVALVVRFANERGGSGCGTTGSGQYLPGWEIARIPTHCDTDINTLIPDWFSGVFQSDVKAFIAALGAHVAAKPWHAAVAYARIAAGLGGESFPVMPGQGDYATDKAWLVNHWGYSPQAWESFQRGMEAAYNAAFTRPVIYVVNKQDTNPATGQPISYDVATQVINGGGGVGVECLRPGGIWNYGDWNAIDAYAASHHAYVQFQTCGPTTTASAEQAIISAAESYHARSVEWYERTAVSPPSRADMAAYQQWVNTQASG